MEGGITVFRIYDTVTQRFVSVFEKRLWLSRRTATGSLPDKSGRYVVKEFRLVEVEENG